MRPEKETIQDKKQIGKKKQKDFYKLNITYITYIWNHLSIYPLSQLSGSFLLVARIFRYSQYSLV